MSQAESYDPYEEYKVLSLWMSTAKDEKRNCFEKTEVREIEKKGILEVRDTKKRKIEK